MSIVTTKDELKAAQERGDLEIIATGKLADDLKASKKVTKIGAGAAALLTATLGVATLTAPITGGLSYFAAAPVAAMSGFEVAAIILAASLGLALLIALFKDYEEISFTPGDGNGLSKLVLRKKQQKSNANGE